MTAAPVESCQFVVLRSPWGRLGSLLDVRKRLHRTRGGFHRCIHISKVLCALLLWTMICHHPRMYRAVPSGRREGMFSGRYSEIFGKSWSRAMERKGPCLYVCTDGSRRACGVGACARLLSTKSDLRETSGPRIDRIPSTRPPWWRRQISRINKFIFFGPQ